MGSVTIYIERKTGAASVQMLGVDPVLGLESPAGPLHCISREEMLTGSATTIERLLKASETAICTPSEGINALRGQQYSAFVKRYLQVKTYVTDDQRLRMVLMRKYRNGRRSGYIGSPEDAVYLNLPLKQDDLNEALRRLVKCE